MQSVGNPRPLISRFKRNAPDNRRREGLRQCGCPTAFDIAFTNNPDLKPERSRSVDVGVDQAFAHSTVVADATFFGNWYDDLIVSVGTQLSGASRFRTDNIANAKSHGLETGVSWRSRVGVSVRGAWTFLHTETLAVDNLPSSLNHIRDGRLRALAVTTEKRSPSLPDVPTTREAGFPSVDAVAWFGVQAPATTPPAVATQLASEIRAALQDPAVRGRVEEQGAEPVGSTPAEFAAHIKNELEKWTQVAKEAGIEPQ